MCICTILIVLSLALLASIRSDVSAASRINHSPQRLVHPAAKASSCSECDCESQTINAVAGGNGDSYSIAFYSSQDSCDGSPYMTITAQSGVCTSLPQPGVGAGSSLLITTINSVNNEYSLNNYADENCNTPIADESQMFGGQCAPWTGDSKYEVSTLITPTITSTYTIQFNGPDSCEVINFVGAEAGSCFLAPPIMITPPGQPPNYIQGWILSIVDAEWTIQRFYPGVMGWCYTPYANLTNSLDAVCTEPNSNWTQNINVIQTTPPQSRRIIADLRVPKRRHHVHSWSKKCGACCRA